MDSPCTSLSLTEREKEKIKIYDALSEAQIIEVLETDENQLTVRFKLKKKDQKNSAAFISFFQANFGKFQKERSRSRIFQEVLFFALVFSENVYL